MSCCALRSAASGSRRASSWPLLSLAHQGLDSWGVAPATRDRLLGIIEQRCLRRRNGATWQIETVRGLETNDATHDAAMALAGQLGKSSITVKSAPGFVVNRILLPMINEAFFVLAEGYASAEDIDKGMKLGCNHPIGPLALADMIGLDVLLSVMQILHDEFADSKYRPCPLLKELVAAGHLGRKSGRGVFTY